jgi:hypothetical protein
VILGDDPELARAVHRHGKSHADALLVGLADDTRPSRVAARHAEPPSASSNGPDGNGPDAAAPTGNAAAVLEPVDFKWTLETAEPRQVGVEVLEALLEAPPEPLRRALERALLEAGADPDGETILHEGIFLAPDHQENRAQLQPRGPLPRALAVLRPVDPHTFFSPLPGWDVAVALARQDGASLERLESAERYYRLGAGVLGALRKLRAGLFAEELPELDGPAELADLRRARALRQTGDVIAYLDRALIARAELGDRLRQVERQAYPYGRYRSDLAARGLGTEEGERRRWERLYGEIMKALGAAIRREGRALVARGSGELEALDDLAANPAFGRQARALLDERLGR